MTLNYKTSSHIFFIKRQRNENNWRREKYFFELKPIFIGISKFLSLVLVYVIFVLILIVSSDHRYYEILNITISSDNFATNILNLGSVWRRTKTKRLHAGLFWSWMFQWIYEHEIYLRISKYVISYERKCYY